ncbi:MAG: polysaccharide pyruvyl transferase family protein, partial [Armatimonadetes bacterium]|nr:polysaccharide pyruvyl transferase family protein [Armatimonadota bacterium]
MFNKRKNPLVVISGYYGYENIGDEAILKAILESISEEISNLKFIVLSNNPLITSQTFNVKAVHRYNFPQIIKAILKSSVFISGGGGLIQDITSFKSLQYYLGLILLAKILRKPVIIYAQGIGPLLHRKSKIFTKFICNLVDLITVRDYASKEELKKLGIKKEILVAADPALTLENKRKNKNSLSSPVLK